MNSVVFFLALAASSNAKLFSMNEEMNKLQFKNWQAEYNVNYQSASEEQKKFEVFVRNLVIIDERNIKEQAAGGTATHGLNKFSDISPEEFASRYLLAKAPAEKSNATVADVKPLTGDVSADWTGTYTTPVKDQGYCGSCWAFSATEQIESDAMRTLSDTYVLSPAQIAQCDTTSYGCDGGWTENAYEYVQSAGGIEDDTDYPYPAKMSKFGITGTCSSDASDFKVTVSGYSTISGESSMASYVGSTGPLSVCLDASTWSSYTGGIMSSCGTDVDHCVQAVGIDTSEGYWKVRNSWGTSWGESGFIRLSYGDNTCDITNDPTYVSVSNV